MMKLTLLLKIFLFSMYAESIHAIEKELSASTRPMVDPLSGSNIVQLVAGLVFVLLMVMLIAWLVRRVGGVTLSGGNGLNVICGMSMGARERVVLLQVGDEQVLIGVSPGRIQTLHVLDTPIDLKKPQQDKINFSMKLAEVIKGKMK